MYLLRVAALMPNRSSLTPAHEPPFLDTRLAATTTLLKGFPLCTRFTLSRLVAIEAYHDGVGLCLPKRGFAMDLSLYLVDQYDPLLKTQPQRSRASRETGHSPAPRLRAGDRITTVQSLLICSQALH